PRTFAERVQRDIDSMREDMDGWEYIEQFYRYFNELADHADKDPLPASHRAIAAMFLRSTLRTVFGDKFPANAVRLMEYFRTPLISEYVFAEMPRRNGKTWLLAKVAAIILWIHPHANMAVFSTGK